MSTVIPTPSMPPQSELQNELTRLVTVFTLARTLEALGVVCELQACTMHEQVRETHRLREIGLDLLTLSERAYAL